MTDVPLPQRAYIAGLIDVLRARTVGYARSPVCTEADNSYRYR